jgi:hypothetical protein
LSLAVGAGGFVNTFDARGLGKTLDWTTLAWMIVPLDGASETGLTNLTNIDLAGEQKLFGITPCGRNSQVRFRRLHLPHSRIAHLAAVALAAPRPLDLTWCSLRR